MRPIRLEVQGLTAYRTRVEVDFSDLDLFAITGPTGAGKSSLVDAISYALFGQVPRMGKSIRELISQGEERLKVSLEFSVRGRRYRVYRESGRKSQKPPQLERFDETTGEWQPEEVDRVKDTNEFIERLLGMDYDAFVRSVLLPQGEFQQFLAGDRDQRRKVLDGLLRLGVYAAMAQRANTIASHESADADRIADRLERELADATPERLAEATERLAALNAELEKARAARDALEAAQKLADELTAARERGQRAQDALREAQEKLEEARRIVETGQAEEEAHRKKVKDLQEEIAANTYDEDAYLRYQKAANIAHEMAYDEREAEAAAKREKQLAAEVEAAAAAAREAAAAYERAREASEKATHALHEARSANAAAALQQGLKPGDDCPVCGGKVGVLPKVAYPKLEDAQKAERKATEAEESALKERQAKESEHARLKARLEEVIVARAEAAAKTEDRKAALAAALAGEALDLATIESRLEELERAREERRQLTTELEQTNAALHSATTAMANARANLGRWEKDVEAAAAEIESAETEAGAAAAKLRLAAADWPEVVAAVDAGKDARPVVGRLLGEQRSRLDSVNRSIGTAEAQIEQIKKDIDLAKGLRKEEKEHRQAARLARDLQSLLRTDAFPTFIRERALRTLAADGSVRLLEISNGRYDFAVEGQDFLIVDRWNGGETRSVKTLSGGETFLASLALALALADHLPGLASDGAASPLECLFIDEGFSHLDNETLDQVASALEVLGQDRQRLIGLVTHVPALAERMPARIVVHKSPEGSTVTVE